MGISAKWFQHDLNPKDPEAHKKREDLVKASTILDTLAEILEAERKELTAVPMDDFDNPNWAYRQAARQGQLSLINKLLSLTKRN